MQPSFSPRFVRGPQPFFEGNYNAMTSLPTHSCLDAHEWVLQKIYRFNYLILIMTRHRLRVLNFPGRLVSCHVSEAWNRCMMHGICLVDIQVSIPDSTTSDPPVPTIFHMCLTTASGPWIQSSDHVFNTSSWRRKQSHCPQATSPYQVLESSGSTIATSSIRRSLRANP